MNIQQYRDKMREGKRLQIRKNQRNLLFSSWRNDLINSLGINQEYFGPQIACRNIQNNKEITKSIRSLHHSIHIAETENQKYKQIMKIIDLGFLHKIQKLVTFLNQNDLKQMLRVLYKMVSLREFKTGKKFVNAGIIPILVSLLQREADFEIRYIIYTTLGNICLEDINYRDVLLETQLDRDLCRELAQRLQKCPQLYNQGCSKNQIEYWNRMIWYLSDLTQNELEYVQSHLSEISIRLLDERLPENAIKNGLEMMYNIHMHISEDQRIRERIQNLLTFSLKFNKSYVKDVLMVLDAIKTIRLSTYKPIYYMINPSYYISNENIKPTFKNDIQHIKLGLRIINNGLEINQYDQELADEYFWQPIINSYVRTDDRKYLIKILSKSKKRQDISWIYRYLRGFLNKQNDALEILTCFLFIEEQLRNQSEDKIRHNLEKFNIAPLIFELQNHKNFAVFEKATLLIQNLML